MKVIPFELNDKDFSVEYFRTREGPNWFRCYYKNSCTGIINPLDAWRVLGVAKFTDTGKKLKQWCLDMDQQYGTSELEEAPASTDKFFDVSEPNDNTKMIT
tara:strand:+ start:202 stop:504 length:303 start_codon:yes stop_codon:yes gene_type:complete